VSKVNQVRGPPELLPLPIPWQGHARTIGPYTYTRAVVWRSVSSCGWARAAASPLAPLDSPLCVLGGSVYAPLPSPILSSLVWCGVGVSGGCSHSGRGAAGPVAHAAVAGHEPLQPRVHGQVPLPPLTHTPTLPSPNPSPSPSVPLGGVRSCGRCFTWCCSA
jgi:hypothetical protein